MSDQPAGDLETGYQICIQGHLGSRWVAWFDGLSLTNEPDGTTLICGPVADQSALHGLLQKVRDLGLPLVSVTRVSTDHTDRPTTAPQEAQIHPQGETT